MARLHLKVGGMHSSFCTQTIERAYTRMEGVEEASVSQAHEEALIEYDGVVSAFEVSRNSYRKTKQNLALAFTFNGVGVPIAATGMLHPIWAMGAMVASVSMVLANSFGGRLLRGEEPVPRPAPLQEEHVHEMTFSVPGIHCEGCEKKVASALKEHDAVEAVEADAHSRTVHVTLRRKADPSELAERLGAAGFEVE